MKDLTETGLRFCRSACPHIDILNFVSGEVVCLAYEEMQRLPQREHSLTLNGRERMSLSGVEDVSAPNSTPSVVIVPGV